MSAIDSGQQADLSLPGSVITRQDIAKLVQEIEQIDAALVAIEAKVRVGLPPGNGPVLSHRLTDFLNANHLLIGDSHVRSELIAQMRHVKDTAPTVHMTFAAEADAASLQQLIAWVRQSVHPRAVIGVGLQPELLGGVYVRTPNHVYDLSIRARLQNSRHLIVEELEAIRAGR